MPKIDLPKPTERDWYECPFYQYVRAVTHNQLIERGSKLKPIEKSQLDQLLNLK